MANWQWFGRVHAAIYRATGGRLGSNLAGRHMLLLTTTGRNSGQPRTTPLAYYSDGGDLVVVASNNGSDRHPAWWLNLEKEPTANVQLGGESWKAEAQAADEEERARLWPLLAAYNPPFEHYRTMTERVIPVVILRRIE